MPEETETETYGGGYSTFNNKNSSSSSTATIGTTETATGRRSPNDHGVDREAHTNRSKGGIIVASTTITNNNNNNPRKSVSNPKRNHHGKLNNSSISNTPNTATNIKNNSTSNNKQQKKTNHNKQNKNKNDPNTNDEIGDYMIRFLNESPQFDYSRFQQQQQQLQQRVGGGSTSRKRGRNNHGKNKNIDNSLFLVAAPSDEHDIDVNADGNTINCEYNDVYASSSSFQPLFSAQNRYRIKVLARCAWILIRNFRPMQDIPNLFRGRFHDHDNDTNHDTNNNNDSNNNETTTTRSASVFECRAILQFLMVTSSLIVLGCTSVSVGITFASVYLWRLARFVGFVVSSLLVDWKEVANACASSCPWWCRVLLEKTLWLVAQFDAVVLFGNRWRGREWNKKGFDFDRVDASVDASVGVGDGFDFGSSISNTQSRKDTTKTLSSSRVSSASRNQYLWALPPPWALHRSSNWIPGIGNSNARNSTSINTNANTNMTAARSYPSLASLQQNPSSSSSSNSNSNSNNNDNSRFDGIDQEQRKDQQRQQQQQQQQQWSLQTTLHVQAIDYCYIMLREEFIEKQYARLQRKIIHLYDNNNTSTSAGGGEDRQKSKPTPDHQNDILRRTSSVSSLESFRQEFVLDPSTNNIDLEDIDEVTGISLKLHEILEVENDFYDDDCRDNRDKNDGAGVAGGADYYQKQYHSNHHQHNNSNYNHSQRLSSGLCLDGDNKNDRTSSRSLVSDDGTATDMNWMDVGHKIGMKLLGSSAVQNALASHDTVEKISTLKEKVDNHFSSHIKQRSKPPQTKNNFNYDCNTTAAALNNASRNDTRSANGIGRTIHDGFRGLSGSPFPRDGENENLRSDEFTIDSTERDQPAATLSTDMCHRHQKPYQLDPYAESLPVHSMWTSAAAAALSPAHSFATIETAGTKELHDNSTSVCASRDGDGHGENHHSLAALSATRVVGGGGPVSPPTHFDRQVQLDDWSSQLSPLSPGKRKEIKINTTTDSKRDKNSNKNQNELALPKFEPALPNSPEREGKPSSSSAKKKASEIVSKISQSSSKLSKKLFQRRRKKEFTKDPSVDATEYLDDSRKIILDHLSPLASKSRRPLLLPGVKIAVSLTPIRPDGPKESKRPSRKQAKKRFQMATVVGSKRLCVYEKNHMPKSGNRGTNCLSITVNLDKCFLRNGHFATMTLRIMDEWGSRYMPKHSKLPMGSCVATSFGLGVLVGWRVEDDCHIVRSLWQHRGSGSACAYLRRDSIHATVESAVGFEVNTAVGRGTVVGYVHGGLDFRSGRYFVKISEEGRNHKQVLELNRMDVLSCPSAQFIPIVEHIRAAAQYQLQIDRYKELQDQKTLDPEETSNKMWGEFSKHFNILWKSFLRTIEEDQEFDDGMNKFIQSCVNFLNKLDAPTTAPGTTGSENDVNEPHHPLDGGLVIHATNSNKSHISKSVLPSAIAAGDGGEKVDSGFWLMNNMFDIFHSGKKASGKTDDLNADEDIPAEGIEVQCTPRRQRHSEMNYARAFAVLRTLTRTVTIAKAASADEPDFKIALSVCHEFLLFVKTVIKVQQKNMDHDSLAVWRSAWVEIVSVFGPVQQRLRRIGEGIAERMEKHGRRAKARLLRFVDFIVQDESLFSAMEQGDWTRCAEQIEVAMVQANIIDERSREHYHKTAQFLYNHFSSATSQTNGAAARNNEKLAQFLLAIQLFAAPRKATLELFLKDPVLEILERIFVRAFSKNQLASRMLSIHCSNFQSLRQFRLLKDFTIAGKLWIPLLDAADEEFSWAVSKLPTNAQEYLSPISSLFSLCVVQFHKMDQGDLTKDWLNFLMEEEAANIIHDLDMKLILALESFSRDIKDTMVVLPYYPSIEDDILHLVDDINVDEFIKEASIALEDEGMLRDFIKEKATVAVERFLDYLPKMSIPVEKRDLGEGWALTCRGAGGGDLTLTELNLKRENLTCQVLGGDSLLFPATDNLNELGKTSGGTSGFGRLLQSMPPNTVKSIEETSVLSVIKEIILNAQRDGCWKAGRGGVRKPPSNRYAAAALDNLPVSSVMNCAIDLWSSLEIDDDELLEIAIRDVSYQIQLKDDGGTDGSTNKEVKEDYPTLTELDSWPTSRTSSSLDEVGEPVRHRFNPRVDPTVLFFEIKKLTFNLENFMFRIEKNEAKRTVFDPAFEGTGSILVRNVLIKLRVECAKGYIRKPTGRFDIPVPVLQLSDLDVSLEEVKFEVQDTGADWLLNKIVEGFGDRFADIISTNLCDQVRKQMNEALQNLNGYFGENPEFLLGMLDISLDDLEEMTVFV